MGEGAKQAVEDFISRLIDDVLWVDSSGEIGYNLDDDTCEAVMQYAQDLVDEKDPDEFEEIDSD